MSDARKRAEEALATVALRYPNGWGTYDTLAVCTSALRDLLAETAEPANCPGCGGLGWIPAGDEQLGCIDCNGTGKTAPAPPEAVLGVWMDSARQFARNESYYRGLIETALKDVPDAYLCDDGTRSEDVLCAKLPDIVAALLAPPPPAGDAVREAAERCREALTSYEFNGGYGVDDEAVRSLLAALAATRREGEDR